MAPKLTESQIFDIWNVKKKAISQSNNKIFFKERDICFISMWKNVRFEQNGKWSAFSRPVAIIKKFNNEIFRGVPLSTKLKEGDYYFQFTANNIVQCAILSQLRLFDGQRLLSKIGVVSQQDFSDMKQKIKSLL